MVATLAGKAGNAGKAGKARNPYHFQGLFQNGWNLIPHLPTHPFHVTLLVESFASRKFHFKVIEEWELLIARKETVDIQRFHPSWVINQE